jgi:hypothetical protein
MRCERGAVNAALEGQAAAVRELLARAADAPGGAFEGEALTVTTRPEPAAWPFAAMVVGFGTGTVLCVEERHLDWARAQTPERHEYLLLPSLAAAARGQGEALTVHPPLIGWALGGAPAARAVPAGYRLERMPREWMNEWQRRDIFPNALGQAVQAHRSFRNRHAAVLFDTDGRPCAVAGVYDTAGLSEIGVDVHEKHRGRGLAPVVVAAAARAALDEDGTVFYSCAPTNIRSQRTALAAGFLPACAYALAYPAGIGLA